MTNPSNFTAPTGRFGLVQSSYEFGHMGTNYDPDQKNVWKFQKCLSYKSCDEMIKNSPCNVGLRYSSFHADYKTVPNFKILWIFDRFFEKWILTFFLALHGIHYNTESMENCICVGRGTTHLEMLFTRVAGGDEDDPSSSMIHQDDTLTAGPW